MENVYFLYNVSSLKEDSISDLEKTIASLGYKRVYPELGGGPSSTQIVAWVIAHYDDVLIGIVSNHIYKLLSETHLWFKLKGKKELKNNQPAIIIRLIDKKTALKKACSFLLMLNTQKKP